MNKEERKILIELLRDYKKLYEIFNDYDFDTKELSKSIGVEEMFLREYMGEVILNRNK